MKTGATAVRPAAPDQAELHATLRFAVGVTAAFVLCEVMQWAPTFLGAVLTVVLLANLPMRPPLKMGVGLVLIQAAAALVAFVLSSLLRGTPTILFGALGLCLFLSFHALLSGRPVLPIILLLISLATIPVVVMVTPSQAGVFPEALIRGMVIAVLAIWASYVFWPRPPDAKPPAPKPSLDSRIVMRLALLATSVVVPLMLVYLLFGLADALPVMIATVVLVINFDPTRSRQHALGMIMANFAGGLLGLLMHTFLLTTPSLPVLTLILFLVLLAFAKRIVPGGPNAAITVVACNAMLIIFSSAIASGPGTLSLWTTRLFQFALAGAFAVGMMNLVWYRTPRRSTPSGTAGF